MQWFTFLGIYRIFLKQIPCPDTWEEPCPETANCSLLPNSSFNFLTSSKGSQLLGFMTFQVLTVSPITPALKQPGRNLLTWLAAVIFSLVLKFWWGQGPSNFISCLFCLTPCNFFFEGPASLFDPYSPNSPSSSLSNQQYGPAAYFVCFPFSFSITGAIMVVWVPVSAIVSSNTVWVPAPTRALWVLWLTGQAPVQSEKAAGFHWGRQSTLLSADMPVCQDYTWLPVQV